jgi:serine/threonine protein kinase
MAWSRLIDVRTSLWYIHFMQGAAQYAESSKLGVPGTVTPSDGPTTMFGRYAVYAPIASGGMATVHVGRLFGEAGFARTVAIKRMHPHLATVPEFVAMFIDEARIAARVRHPNVVGTLDVGAHEGELFLVMDYVEGLPLSALNKAARARGVHTPPEIVATMIVGMLRGLDAAHEACGDDGAPLGIVHRDISPQNVLVGTDGVPRVLDFGVAKALTQIHHTQDSQLKGKLPYMDLIDASTCLRRPSCFGRRPPGQSYFAARTKLRSSTRFSMNRCGLQANMWRCRQHSTP